MKKLNYSKKLEYWMVIVMPIILSFPVILSGCQKFLDQKPEKNDVIPTTLDELQRLLDNNDVMNSISSAALSEMVSDNYYITTAVWQSQRSSSNISNQAEASNYIWESNGVPLNRTWNDPYLGPIYYSNIVIDQLSIIKGKTGEEGKLANIKGSALFYRSYHFHQLAQLYCKPFSTENANQLGIVLRLTSNVGEESRRATVQETYDQIVNDLSTAADLLPETALFPTQPSKLAAYAALARVYLSMRNYPKAGEFANKALQIKSNLINYNTLTPVGSTPITYYNEEVIFHSFCANGIILGRTRARIDSSLYNSYATDDLRKKVFFSANTGPNAGSYSFRGSYFGVTVDRVFDGLTTDELYLIRAESSARAGNTSAAMDDLNALMIMRWKDGSFSPLIAGDASEALLMVLTERRKELVYRGIRWSDIRRLNLESNNITLKRVVDGITYELPPNDLRTVMLIPWDEINRSGIAQNPR
jgi:starch-binding outer membrane protein, SusD/RagB family